MHATRFDRLTVLLHWSMALLIPLQIALGLWMVELPKDDSGTRAGWFNVHKSVGMVLLLLIGLRMAWLPWRSTSCKKTLSVVMCLSFADGAVTG